MRLVAFDATHFYLGHYTASLAEIDTLRTCTFTDLVAEPVDYPFYVVPNTNGDAAAIWYRSGDRVRKLVLP